MKIVQNSIFYLVLLFATTGFGQNISLFKQFNGRFDFVFFGNTLNQAENGQGGPCVINTSSIAALNLASGDVVENAYLYWAGSGTGDINVKLNGVNIISQRNFSVLQGTSGLTFFSAFADITTQIKNTGNGLYTLSDLDLTGVIDDYCSNATNFGGWAIIVVYKNPILPLNQLGVYDGLQFVPSQIDITLNSLNVIDNMDAKIGFIAWEGDRLLHNNETLRINGNDIGNPPLNPVDNAFNGTNSFTGATDLYNMDLDVYNIQNNINIGDTTAEIQLTSSQDFVMINAIVTKLNSQLPDATINIDDVVVNCDSNVIVVDYTVSNINCTDILLTNTPIAIYVNGVYLQSTATVGDIPVEGTQTGQVTLTIPAGTVSPFDLQFIVDDDGTGTGTGIRIEIEETNNRDLESVTLLFSPTFNPVDNLETCNLGLSRGLFNFANYDDLIKTNPSDTVQFFETLVDAQNNVNPVLNPTNYIATTTPKLIFARLDNSNCSAVTSFLLITRNCPPEVHDFVSADGDSFNDSFYVEGLRDIFLNYKTSIYNRWGTLVWSGNNNTPDWDGFANKGALLDTNEIPAGTYYYVIELNDPDYSKPLTGYLYLTR
ncbi:MAG: gliding motility-associated C-terminal domain-containing protein [Bacteroidota bacterium]